MRYEIDENNYITDVYFNCFGSACAEYTGNIPDGYTSLEDWASNANIQAYKIVDNNLVYDSVKDAELQAKWAEESQNNQPGGGTGIKLLDVYPIGSIYMSVTNVNPSTLFGGTWVAWGSGRVPVGVDTSQTEFATVEKAGGEKTHTLTANEMPVHSHQLYAGGGGPTEFPNYTAKDNGNTGASVTTGYDSITGYRGGSQPHNNLQPYITCYMWKRTA